MMGVEQSSLQTGTLSAPLLVTAILDECSAITDYRTLRDTLPGRLMNLLSCRSVLLYQCLNETLQLASGTFDDKPGWSASLLAVAHINPIDLNSTLPEAVAWRSRHAVIAPANSPTPRLVAVPLIYRQRAIGVLVAIRSKEGDSGELDVDSATGEQESSSHQLLPDNQPPTVSPTDFWTAGDVQTLEAVAGIVALLLENTRLLERDRERIHELSLLNSISSQMSSSFYQWERMRGIIVQRTREIATTDLCAVLRSAPPATTVELPSWLAPSLQEKLYRYVSGNANPLIIERPGDSCTQEYLQYLPANIKTLFVLPLLSSRSVAHSPSPTGVLHGEKAFQRPGVSNGKGAKEISERVLGMIVGAYHRPWKVRREELVLLQVLASQASAALENMQLMAEVMEARNEARKLLRQVLEDQRLKELILQSIPSGLITVSLEGQITTFNHAAQIVLGYLPSEVLGQPLQKILVLDAVRKVIATAQEQHETVEAADRHGQEVVLDVSIMPLRDDRNTLIGALLTFTDVTAMHLLEEEKRRLDRLASLGEMSASVAHEVRNPLASIKTSMQMLMDDLTYGADEQLSVSQAMNMEAQESVSVVLSEVERLDSIVRDLLLFARPRQLHRVSCNLCALSDHVLDIMHMQYMDAGIEVHRLYQPVPLVRADISQMEQVLFNLYTNALQAMPEGGILTVSCSVVTGEQQWLEFVVSDTGVGIQLNQLERIFRPFFTTRAHGIGLGLPITRRLVEDHRGTLSVESQLGYGATFTLRLPLESQAEDEPYSEFGERGAAEGDK
ncbi:MAG TPA: ATP-binding protein [Ktedonobacteraceae bacterium]|nr:ATP-binding protein [Ktedonobacteraceae bacterium]